MRLFKRLGRRVVVPAFALAVTAGIVVPVNAASAATFNNACTNNATTNNTQIPVTMTADSPASVPPGAAFGLTKITQTLDVPSTVFVSGYNLGLLVVGPNTVPAKIKTVIEGTNTTQLLQTTNEATTSISTTVSDPDGAAGSGDETATPGSMSVSYADQTWTAGASGTVSFREDTRFPLSDANNGIFISATVGPLTVKFRCSPGNVAPDPAPVGTVTQIDPAAPFASSAILIDAPPPPPPPGPPPPPAPVPVPAPVVSSARLSSTAFRAANKGASLTAKRRPPIGTNVSYRNSQAATTTFAVLRAVTGHKSGTRCVAGAPRRNQKRCTRYVSVGSFTHRDQAGNIRVHFTGRVRGRKLSPGRYRLRLTPKASGKTGNTATLSFRIVL